MKKIALLPISLFAALALTACGDDSSSPAAPEGGSQPALSSDALPGSSDSNPGSSTTDPGSSGAVPPASSTVEPGSSASVPPGSSAAVSVPEGFTAEAVVVPETNCTTAPVAFGVGVEVTCDGQYLGPIMEDDDKTAFDPNAASYADFVGIQKVFASLQADEKVVFLMRHAHRTNSTDVDGVLTGWGYLQAENVGQKIASAENILYWHSEVPRTLQTCMAIAKGRGQTEIIHKALPELNGGWFEKDHSKIEEYNATVSSSYEVISRWAYNEYKDEASNFDEGFYNLMERGEQFMQDIVVAQVAAQSRISVIISHDQMIFPMVIFATNKQIEMKYHEDKSWLNFLAGVAIIIKADGSKKYVPLKGLDSGFQ